MDSNDNAPFFVNSPFTFYFAEEQAANTVVGRFLATDADLDKNGDVTYVLLSGHLFNDAPRWGIAS